MQMLIKVVANTVGKIWEVVKPAVIRADGIEAEHAQAHLNKLLHDLLSNKAQLFLRTNEKQTEIKTIIITRLLFDTVKKQKYLLIQTYYAFSASNDAEWDDNLKVAMEFAKQEECEYIAFKSINPRIIAMGKSVGFATKYTLLELQLGGA
jgi:hypothetical protein